DTHDEAEVRVGARPETELVEVERQGRDGRVVADENDLGALEREGAVALRVAAVLADRDPDRGAGGVEDPVARVAVGEVVGLEDLVEVGADLLGEVRRERHLRVGDPLDALPRRLGEQTQHPLDDLLATGALVVGTQLRGGDLYMARHYGSPLPTNLQRSPRT